MPQEQQGAEPLFRSVNHALAFAYNFTHGTLKRSGMAKMMDKAGGGTGRGLAGLDGAGQAGMIKQCVESLDDVHRHVLIARFSPRSDPCSCGNACCRGWRPTRSWEESIKWLVEHVLVMGLVGNISHYRFRRAVVARYFGENISFLTIASECGVHRNTASNLNAKVVGYFAGNRSGSRGVEWHARNELETKLHDAGVIE